MPVPRGLVARCRRRRLEGRPPRYRPVIRVEPTGLLQPLTVRLDAVCGMSRIDEDGSIGPTDPGRAVTRRAARLVLRAWEQPDLFAGEMRASLGSLR